MSIQPNQPHIIMTIDPQGNITSEACNYPSVEGVCQGEQATAAFEESLAAEGLIPPVDRIDRQYKPSAASRQTQQVQSQIQQ